MITLSAVVPNNADWQTQFQFGDGETGDLLDFTGASIELEIRDGAWCGTRVIASTDNGLITIISLGIFELLIPASQMECLCPETYRMGAVYSLNGSIISLFTGPLTITDGASRI
jgi:hypothetical protein